MKALTLTQPWATLVAIGAKRIETRSWSTSYRGPLLIHAAKGFPPDCQELCFEEPFRGTLAAAGFVNTAALPLGAIVAVCDLIESVDVEIFRPSHGQPQAYLRGTFIDLPPHERAFGNYDLGRKAWVLDNVREIPKPIPCRGYQQLWVPPAEVMEQVRAQLAVPA